MSEAKPLPPELRIWAEQHVGPVVSVRDASHARPDSRVWELRRGDGVRYYLKVSPNEKSFTRESLAYRHAVPALGHSRAPQLVDSRAEDLALLLTAVPGAPVKGIGLTAAEHRAMHRQAGALIARLHEAGEVKGAARADAEAAFEAAADGAEKHLARAGDRLACGEQRLIRDHADRLRRVAAVPVGLIHGDNQPRNWLWSRPDRSLALVDYERSRPAPVVQDLAILASAEWVDHPDREKAFLQGFGRRLTGSEQSALRCLTVLDAVSCLAWGPDNGDPFVTARGRRTLDRLMREDHP
ncbi:phosphotransferase [Streptomyces sp. NBC_01565]|uniref:phosphotransferase enzyme family protein n=1 Tax=unclassified Streptomyces TaxID=2593676 RepID=UPI0022516876|nr:phosphotransferase [Streptomyces sp. NBC_01565]MCX4546148.1 phosphotransferase [Streptomyces sp. NBC_01565]